MNNSTENPFLSITPREDEKIIGIDEKKIAALTKKVVSEKVVLIVIGEYGSGKSLVADGILKKIAKKIVVKKMEYGVDLKSELLHMPVEQYSKNKTVFFIDRFDLSEAHKDKELKEIMEAILNITKAGSSFVLYCTPNLLERMNSVCDEFKKWSTSYRVPPLSYEQSRELIMERLNEVRNKKSNDIKPFEESELDAVIKNAKGNPRLLLLLAAAFYDMKRINES